MKNYCVRDAEMVNIFLPFRYYIRCSLNIVFKCTQNEYICTQNEYIIKKFTQNEYICTQNEYILEKYDIP